MYDKDYYENGILTGKSCYENYRWIPELTIPLAMTIIDYMGIKRNDFVLDFGCAKGYLVKALRWLSRYAYGYDISEYALAHTDSEIKDYVKNYYPARHFDYCIAKDVFEHIEEDALADILERTLNNTSSLFVIVPLGEDGAYRASANNQDSSHIICMPEIWWSHLFNRCGWTLEKLTNRVDGIKDKYYEKCPAAHGFFTLVKR